MAAIMIVPWAPVNVLLGNWALAVPIVLGGLFVVSVFPLNLSGRHVLASIVLMVSGLLQIIWGVWTYGMPPPCASGS